MSESPVQVVLASASARRLELLAQLGVSPEVMPADIDESARVDESPKDYVLRLACEKAQVISSSAADSLVIGADTTIDAQGRLLGKPENGAHASEMLSALSGREHFVHTGVAVASADDVQSLVVTTRVEFMSITSQDIEAYVDTGEPFGKAGGYAIQGVGAILIRKIEGSYSNVVGLPLTETAGLMKRFGYCVLSHHSADRSGH